MLKQALTTNQPVYQSSTMELSYPDHQILKVVLKGFQKTNEAIENRKALLAAVKERHIRLLLVDERQLRVLSDDMKHLLASTIDQVAQTGIRRVAVLVTENIYVRSGIEQVQNILNARHVITDPEIQEERKGFGSEADGIKWLLS